MRFDSRYTANVRGDRSRIDSISEETVEYEYEYRPPRRTEYGYEKKTDEKKHRTECAPCNVPFFLAPWNPFLASLEIREWKETPSHARASFLGGIGFIGPNASFS
jgi:hypothetical protein